MVHLAEFQRAFVLITIGQKHERPTYTLLQTDCTVDFHHFSERFLLHLQGFGANKTTFEF